MKSELTLLIDSANFADLARHPIWHRRASVPPSRRRQTSHCFDTQDFDLWQFGFALRVCRVNRQWEQILENRGRQLAGLRQYHAWQTPVKFGLPDVAALLESVKDDKALTRNLSLLLQSKPMVPVFAAQNRHTCHFLRVDGWDQIEVKAGHIELQYGELRTDSCEIVLRLVAGDPGCLYRFAQELLAIAPLRLGHASLAERGYAMCMPQSAGAVKAGGVNLDSSMSVQQALYEIISMCSAQIQANESGVVSGNNPEYIHQMRVGLRRLNLAFELIRELLPCPPTLREALSQIRRDLGAARDWEVLAGDMLGGIIKEGRTEEGLVRLQTMILRQAAKNRRQAAGIVLSERYTHSLLALGVWAQEMLGQPIAVVDSNVEGVLGLGAFVQQVMARRDAHLHKRGKRLLGANDEARHEMRLSAKKLRYAAEFFEALYPAAKLRAYVDGLAEMQQVLGVLNDAVVADELLLHRAVGAADLAPTAGFVRGYLAARSLRDILHLAQLWRRFKKLQLPDVK